MHFSTFFAPSLLALSALASLHAPITHPGARSIANHRRHHAKARNLVQHTALSQPEKSKVGKRLRKRCARQSSNSTTSAAPGGSTNVVPSPLASNSSGAGTVTSSAGSGLPGFVASYGINDGTLLVNGIALGFLPDFTQTSIEEMNAALPSPMPIVGDYISVTPSDLSMGNLQWHRSDLVAQGTKPVYMATIMPQSLSSWDSTQADAVAQAMADLNANGVPTWVRFAYEMNGCPAWNNWGCDPSGFQAAWSIMAASLRSKAPQAKMFWAPNVDGSNNGLGNYADYWPSDDSTVDIVGLSFYSFGVDQTQNTLPDNGLFESLAGPFYAAYAEGKGKAFAVAETSAPYHYETGTTMPAPGGASEYDMKTQWLAQLTGADTHAKYPKMIAAVWFNFMKDERAETLDFRAVLGNSQVANAVHALA